MKKKIIILLCFIMVFSFVSCKKDQEEATQETVVETVAKTATETVAVAVAETEEKIETETIVKVMEETPSAVISVVEAPIQTDNSYKFTLMGAEINATLKDGIANVIYPKYVTNEEIASGLYYIGLILNVNPSDFTYTFPTPGEVELTYPMNISDDTLIKGFKLGLNYYLAYYDYTIYNFDLYGYKVMAGINNGDAIVAYPSVFETYEVKGILDLMLTDAAMPGFTYSMIGNRVVEITYPNNFTDKSIIDGFSAEFAKVLPSYLKGLKSFVEEKTNFVQNFKEFEFYIQNVFVTGKVTENDVTFNYDSDLFNEYLEEKLIKVASTMTNFDASDFTYEVTDGQLVFTYANDINPEAALDAFFGEVFAL